MNSLILTALVNVSCGNSASGCPQAIEATMKQYGFYESVLKWENKNIRYTEDLLKKNTSIESQKAVMTTFFIVNSLRGGSTTIRLGTGPIKETYILQNKGDFNFLSVNLNF